MATFTKTFDGKKFNYFFNGVLYRKSANEYKYGCFAIRNKDGKEIPAALGNDENSTLKSNWKRYCEYCELKVVKISIL
jgi:hypothetical protein